VGTYAIATAGRGIYKDVTVPFYEDASDCVGCLSCAVNCPTGHIRYEETDSSRTIWKRTFGVRHCTDCGAVIGTPEQIAHYAKKSDLEEAYFEKCDVCRKKEAGIKLQKVVTQYKLES
jgi:Fe-S-cluster-containing hydrogenase component 2